MLGGTINPSRQMKRDRRRDEVGTAALPTLTAVLLCSNSDKNDTTALVRGRLWHPHRRDRLMNRSIFQQAYVPPRRHQIQFVILATSGRCSFVYIATGSWSATRDNLFPPGSGNLPGRFKNVSKTRSLHNTPK